MNFETQPSNEKQSACKIGCAVSFFEEFPYPVVSFPFITHDSLYYKRTLCFLRVPLA